jgi:hypothetical protein
MMTAHVSPEKMEAFRADSLPADQAFGCAEHFAACEECGAALARAPHFSSRPLAIDFSAGDFTPDEHVEYEKLVPYAEGRIKSEEAVLLEAHLRSCARCREEVRVFCEFLMAVGPEMAQRYGPQGVRSRVAEALGFWRLPRWVPFAVGFLVIAVLFSLAVLPLRQPSVTFKPEVTPAPPSTPPAPGSHDPSVNKGGEPLLVVAVRDNGREYGLDRDGNPVGTEYLPTTAREAVAAALRRQDMAKPRLLGELTETGVKERAPSRGGRTEILISPLRTAVFEDRPVLRWRAVPGATGYVVRITGADFRPVAESGELAVTSWRVATPLPRGAVYVWQVTALKGGEEMIAESGLPGRFKVISGTKLKELMRARRESSSHLAVGLLYAREGLLDDAEREFLALRQENPRSSLARRFLSRVRSWRAP